MLGAFANGHDVCGEFLARQDRITKHHYLAMGFGHRGSAKAMRGEYARYGNLTLEVSRQAVAVFESLGLPEDVVDPNKNMGLFYSELIEQELLTYNCLGRTCAHCYLDVLLKYYHPSEWDLRLLVSALEGNLGDQDILERTPLHIACQLN
jgi:hypothetical protein